MNDLRLLPYARDIFASALRESSIEAAFQRKTRLVVEAERSLLQIAGAVVDLADVRHLRIVSAGKAAGKMLASFLRRAPLPPGCDTQGVLIARERPDDLPAGFQFFPGGHPIPNQASFDGASAALNLVTDSATLDHALCVFLISGGASAMMELPFAPEISLDDTVDLYRLLVHSAAPIGEINCIRKHFSAVKGGRLALAAGDTPALTLLVSDVPPRRLDTLASGPTVADPSTVEECRELLRRYSLVSALPRAIQEYFAGPSLQETLKPGGLAAPLGVLLDSDDLVAAAERSASALGFHVVIDHTCDDWPYDEAARYLLDRIRALRGAHARACLLSAGEVTVPVPNTLDPTRSHVGGRNQHCALYFATLLTPSDEGTVFLSAGSDGIDGNSSAAGAVVSTTMLQVDGRRELACEALLQFDSSTLLQAWNADVVTGPTGNNLRDLRILLAER